MTQHKGDSECRAGRASDELCGYEKLSLARMMDMASRADADPPPPDLYVREALGAGSASASSSA